MHPLLTPPDPVQAARALLGAELITSVGGHVTSVRITETEAYFAPEDRASHAFAGKRTKRTEVFFAAPGTAYVYLCYGIHEMMNVVTGPAGVPHAVLIRAGSPVRGIDVMEQRRKVKAANPRLSSGPGVLTKALGIDRTMNGLDLSKPAGPIHLVMPKQILPDEAIASTPRIGIDYAGEPWVSKPWRFYVKDSIYVSRLKKN